MQQIAANLRQKPNIDAHAIRIAQDPMTAEFDALSGSLLSLTVKLLQQHYRCARFVRRAVLF
jgi:hypothetical protein